MSETKPTNPKDFIGSTKMPVHLWPNTATLLGTLAMLDGAAKYGRSNWRVSGVKASIYYDAARRHLDAWFEGEDKTKDSKVHHLGHALACIAIIVDAEAAGKLNDDRMYPGGFDKLLQELTPMVVALKEQHKDKEPHHFTAQDQQGHYGMSELERYAQERTRIEDRPLGVAPLCGKLTSVDGTLANARRCPKSYGHEGSCS